MPGIELSQQSLTGPASREAGRRPVPGKWRAAALYTALTLVLMYPLSLHPGSLIPGDGPDTQLNLWVLSWNVHAFTHQPLGIFNANDFYPQLRTLAYQDSLIGSAFIAAPVIWATGNPLLAANVILILATILCGVGAYTLGRRLGLSEPGALLCGLVFAFSPPRFLRYSQLPLAPVQWIPFALASLHAYLDGGRRRDLWFAIGFVSLQTLTSSHAAVFAIVAVVILLAYRVLFGEPVRLAARLRDFGIRGVLLFVPVVLTYWPYRINQRELGLRRDLSEWTRMYESFLASPTYLHRYLLSALGLSRINEEASGFLFPGYLPLLLSAIAAAAAVIAAIRWLRAPRSDTGRHVRLQFLLAALTVVAASMTARRLFLAPAAFDPITDWRGLLPWLVAASVAAAMFFRARNTVREMIVRDRRPLMTMAVTIVVWSLLIVMRWLVPAGNGLVSRYYANETWTGEPAITSADARPSIAAIHERWPSAPAKFSVRWNGFIAIPAAGSYEFSTTSDDGSRLWIDGKPVVENGGVHARVRASGTVWLEPGAHAVVLEYAQAGADSWLEWSMSQDDSDRPVPVWMLSQRRTSAISVLVARALTALARVCAATAIAVTCWWLVILLRREWPAWGEEAVAARRAAAPVYLVLTVVCIGLAMGPPYGLWQYVYWWPGFSFIRAPLRFVILGVLGLAVLTAIGLERLTTRLSPAQRRLAFACTGALMLGEFLVTPIFAVPFAVTIPAADRWLASQPTPFVVAEVPVGPERYQTTYMLHSTAHWQRTVAGYGGIRPELNEIVNAELRSFPDERSVQHLIALGVTHVVVHLDFYAPEDRPAMEQRLRTFDPDRLKLEFSDETSRVYSLHHR